MLLITAIPRVILVMYRCSSGMEFIIIGDNKALCTINLPREGLVPSNGFASTIDGVFVP